MYVLLTPRCSWRKCAGRQFLWEAGWGPPTLRVSHCSRRAVMWWGQSSSLSFLTHWTPSQVLRLASLSSTCCHIPLTGWSPRLLSPVLWVADLIELITVEKRHPVEWSLFNESLLSHRCWKLAYFCLKYYLEFNDPHLYFATCLPGIGNWGLTCSMTSVYVHFAYWYAVIRGHLKCLSK